MAGPRMKRVLLWALGIFLTIVGISKNPMLLIFPMWIFTYLNRGAFRRLVRGKPLSVSFIGFGLLFGMLTEIFAIVNNRHLPPEQRILLSPVPVLDFVYGIFYYLMLIVTWFVLIKALPYSKSEVFVIKPVVLIRSRPPSPSPPQTPSRIASGPAACRDTPAVL